jgi:putative transposase
MSDTYSKINIQIVFAVKNRQALIKPEWEIKLHKYITGIIQGKDQILIAINGMPDHIHILIGMRPTCCLSDLVREIKKASTAYIKEEKLTEFPFRWQEGFGAFSYSAWDVNKIVNYIGRQKEHHAKTNFEKEYNELLREFEVEFKKEHLFEWILEECDPAGVGEFVR